MAGKSVNWDEIAWPLSHLGELVENLARKAGYVARPSNLPAPPEALGLADDDALGRWIDVNAGGLGLEAEAIDSLYVDVERMIRAIGPAIVRLPGSYPGDKPHLIGLVRSGSRRAVLLTPTLKTRRLPIGTLQAALCSAYEEPLAQGVEGLLQEAGVPEERRGFARKAFYTEQLGPMRIQAGWILRLPPGASLRSQFRQTGAFRAALIMLGMFFLQQLLAIASWFVIGRGVFQGHFDLGWLLAWALLLLATIPLAMIVSDSQAELSMSAGAVFKQRLIHGALKLEPEEIRHQGMGQFLGRVMESEAVEMLALNGGFLALLSFVELILAGVILYMGAGGAVSVALLALWVMLTLAILWRYFQVSREWAGMYREMTNDLVERMVGHRTRLIQEDRRHWHDAEDLMLDRYLKYSERLDGAGIRLSAFISRGWMLVGLVGLAYPFISGSASPQSLAVGLGGILFASQALNQLVGGAQSLVSLYIAWAQVGPLFDSAARPRELQSLDFAGLRTPEPGRPDEQGQPLGQPVPASQPEVDRHLQTPIPAQAASQPLLVARDLVFRYRPQGRPVIQEASLQIDRGDRLLLEGPSGGGKTTLAAILTGLRVPQSGSLFLWGFDRQLLGSEEWRRRVVMAPQYQENYVFSETFAFNLLLGRRWPPLPEDLKEAETLCRELGLGEVLDRMPSGFQQMLGESGWQLSHGERSRLFIARTLLQKADLIILDESFGALDPENLNRALRCVFQRASTLLVIAHP